VVIHSSDELDEPALEHSQTRMTISRIDAPFYGLQWPNDSAVFMRSDLFVTAVKNTDFLLGWLNLLQKNAVISFRGVRGRRSPISVIQTGACKAVGHG
jgi:hypothetical protein